MFCPETNKSEIRVPFRQLNLLFSNISLLLLSYLMQVSWMGWYEFGLIYKPFKTSTVKWLIAYEIRLPNIYMKCLTIICTVYQKAMAIWIDWQF